MTNIDWLINKNNIFHFPNIERTTINNTLLQYIIRLFDNIK